MPRKKDVFDAMREKTCGKIEAAALSLFARNGLSVTVGDIAKAAGISQGLMYRHYPSKQALIIGLVRRTKENSLRFLEGIAKSNDPAAKKIICITDTINKAYSGTLSNIDYSMFTLQVELSGFQSAELAALLKSPYKILSKIIEQGQSEGTIVDGDPILLATTYWAAVQGICCFKIAGLPFIPTTDMLLRILIKEPAQH